MALEARKIAPDTAQGIAGVTRRAEVSAARCTTFAIGGELLNLLEVESREGLTELLLRLSREDCAYRVLGAGSNLLVSDAGIIEPILRLGRAFRYLRRSGPSGLVVGGSYSLMALSRDAAQLGLSGLEFAGGIPASLGGAVRMNAGAHAGELAQVIQSVTVALPDGTMENLRPEQCGFAYRRSALPRGAIVIEAELKLAIGDITQISAQRAKFLSERRAAQPLTAACAGSVFKNPPGPYSAGKLIEAAGLKGRRCGGAQISPMHGNWIVNPDRQASCEDVRQLIRTAQSAVFEQTGVLLEPELIYWR